MILLIDGNAFINVSLAVVRGQLLKDIRVGKQFWVEDVEGKGNFLLKSQTQIAFRRFVGTYLSSILNQFKGKVKYLVFAFDSLSWRRKFIKEHFESEKTEVDFAYKGNRKEDDKKMLFFDFFFSDILPVLEESGITSYRVKGLEGDDIIAFISSKSQQDLAIWSVDADLMQLVKSNKGRTILMMPKMQTKFKRVVTDQSFFDVQESSEDPFAMDDSNFNNKGMVSLVKSMANHPEYNHLMVDIRQELLKKILRGDSSDSIKRVHKKLSEKKADAVIDLIKDSSIWNDLISIMEEDTSRFIDFTADAIKTVLGLKEDELDQLKKDILVRLQIIRLSPKFFPQDLVENLIDLMRKNKVQKFSNETLRKVIDFKL